MLLKKDYFAGDFDKIIFSNDRNSMLPQTVCGKTIREHFANSKKTPKALIIGFDGARADSMKCVAESGNDDISGKLFHSEYSAVNTLKNEGGLYLSYAGGDAPDLQETSTAQGWSAILTGVWGKDNGVISHVPIKTDCPTVLRYLAERGKKSAFLAEWEDHFTITYKEEIRISKENNIPLEFKRFRTDEELEKGFVEQINSDTDCIFGIFEAPDYNGHSYGFSLEEYRYVSSVCSLDRIAYKLIETVKSRPTFCNEDWLVLITSDHGGHKRGHGTQKQEDRNTFIACNKKIKA